MPNENLDDIFIAAKTTTPATLKALLERCHQWDKENISQPLDENTAAKRFALAFCEAGPQVLLEEYVNGHCFRDAAKNLRTILSKYPIEEIESFLEKIKTAVSAIAKKPTEADFWDCVKNLLCAIREKQLPERIAALSSSLRSGDPDAVTISLQALDKIIAFPRAQPKKTAHARQAQQDPDANDNEQTFQPSQQKTGITLTGKEKIATKLRHIIYFIICSSDTRLIAPMLQSLNSLLNKLGEEGEFSRVALTAIPNLEAGGVTPYQEQNRCLLTLMLFNPNELPKKHVSQLTENDVARLFYGANTSDLLRLRWITTAGERSVFCPISAGLFSTLKTMSQDSQKETTRLTAVGFNTSLLQLR
ncbi:MAG: hypothetical protein A3E84_02950 [Gammaproteobacteria bacterium RIFCSPHIGHO2_12_FULL_42_13]|nr:MAG: hypothetical protein A3E84_02950 [Gammaproteobacteria bacterium RIFCSPHIGHO2_12_FULL_42_13]